MKTIVIAVFLLVVLQLAAGQQQPKTTSRDRIEKCIKDLNLDKNKIDSLFKDSKYLPEDDEDIAAFIGCVWISGEYMDKNGKINYDNIIKLVADFPRARFGAHTPDTVGVQLSTDAANSCKSTPPGNTPGHTATKFQNCMTKYIIGALNLPN